MSDACTQILKEALDKLIDREMRLAPFVTELDECRAARKELERAIDKAEGKRPSGRSLPPVGRPALRAGGGTGPPSTGDASPRGRFRGRIVEVLKRDGALTSRKIADALEYEGSLEWLNGVIVQGVRNGEIRDRGDGSWVAAS